VTSGYASAQGSVALDAGEGAVAFASQSNPNSAYVAFEGDDRQVEVFDPTRGVARRLVTRGAVDTVPTKTVSEARAATPAEIRQLAASLGQPIYWAGRRPSVTYEVSQNADGSIFVRYLPEDTSAGSPEEHLTVATYPLAGAHEQTKALGEEPGMEVIDLGKNAIAVFSEAPGTNHGYVAFPGVDYQIEVFDPAPGAARRVVEAGRIAPVG
jgi:hypothetical protein